MRRSSRWVRFAAVVVIVWTAGSAILFGISPSPGSPTPPPDQSPGPTALVTKPSTADASALYNEGTDALARGDLGAAVALLGAASRIEPRAKDIRMNLAIARGRSAEALGEESNRGQPPRPSALSLSSPEAWWLAAALIAVGAMMGMLAALGRSSRSLARAGLVVTSAGLLLWGGLFLRAREEARHPEAVVVVPLLSVGPAPDERPRPPYLLGAGEEVRLGRTRGDLVEIRVGGNAVGWAQRSGLWRVADAARYTSKSTSN